MRIKMKPHVTESGSESGIKTIIGKYFQHLPKYGIELVRPDATSYDLVAAHAGMVGGECDVSHLHGIYFTADYTAPEWEYRVNARVVESIRNAKIVTVPSDWVAEVFHRDCRFTPVVVPHGVDLEEWQHNRPNKGYIIGYAKNRVGDVCDPSFLTELGRRFSNQIFTTTFAPKVRPNNVKVSPVMPHEDFKTFIQEAAVYISPVKETWGVLTAEAMASGVPVLGWNYGGNSLLVSHGVNGYLAEPGNIDDLCDGLAYCLRYRDVLGANGRELAKQWSWENACQKLVAVYEQALQPDPVTVSVVIPVYNKPIEQLERAVESASRQSLVAGDRPYPPIEIIVVDDGSADGAPYEALIRAYQEKRESGIAYQHRRLNNGGVATARNRGIEWATGKYICALDGDDFLEPTFLEVCISALEADRSLGIAYTGLRAHNLDGSTTISPWPPDFNPDKQLRYPKLNQVPTACVFRREAWQRIGGYRSRYCPNGAGSEDAAFWSAICSIGYNARKVTDEPLFNYSAGGQVGGNREYKEIDWLSMYPWARDGQHPFASVATPERHSHPVRQYDQPDISVIIPVGPGHEQTVRDALDSLEMQHFRKWEAVVVLDTDKFDNETEQALGNLVTAYPYVRWRYTGATEEEKGRFGKIKPFGAGFARNRGVEIARAPFLFFLDADDVLARPDALDKFLAGWQQAQAIVYSDYLGKSTWSREQAEQEYGNRLLGYLERPGQAVVSYRAANYDCERAQRQPEYDPNNPKMPYYLWCTVSVLIPKAWHAAIGGFDEAMMTWEDADYFWRLARASYCFHKIPEPLLLYDYDSGNRRESGIPRNEASRQKHQSMINYIKQKYEKQPPEMCNCRGKRAVVTPDAVVTGEIAKKVYGNFNDEDFVLITFTPNYAGNRQLIGPATKIKYGYSRRANEQFLVHKDDVKAQPHMFKPVPAVPEAPAVEIAPPPEPVLVAPAEPAVAAKPPAPARPEHKRAPAVKGQKRR